MGMRDMDDHQLSTLVATPQELQRKIAGEAFVDVLKWREATIVRKEMKSSPIQHNAAGCARRGFRSTCGRLALGIH